MQFTTVKNSTVVYKECLVFSGGFPTQNLQASLTLCSIYQFPEALLLEEQVNAWPNHLSFLYLPSDFGSSWLPGIIKLVA